MIRLVKQYKIRAILCFWLIFISILTWKSKPTIIDEYYTVFITRGISIGCFWGGEARSFITANPCRQNDTLDLSSQTSLKQTFIASIKDGGNGILYYGLAHYWSGLLGPYIGIINSLRLLSFIFSFISLLILSDFLSKKMGYTAEFTGGLFFISTSIPNLLFIRSYPLAVLFTLILFLSMIKWMDSGYEKMNYKNQFLFWFVALCMPFIHFFTIIFIFLYVGLVLYKWYKGLANNLVIQNLIPLLISIFLFSFYYFNLNHEGRIFQKQLSEWYTEVSTNSLLKEYKPSVKLSLMNVVKKNTWAWARAFGLKLNQPHYKYAPTSLMHSTSYVLIVFFIILLMLFIYAYFKLGNTKITNFCIYNLMGYFLFMNLLSLKLDHLIVFNEQYFFILFPLAAILFGVSYLSVSKLKGFHKHIQVLILTIILINSIVYGFLPPDMDTDRTYLHSRILSKLENNFESTPR